MGKLRPNCGGCLSEPVPGWGLGLYFRGSPNPVIWLLLLPLSRIDLEKEVLMGRREECWDEHEWLGPRRQRFRNRENILKPW